MKKSEKDELILAALIANPTTKAASEQCGISTTQIYERLKDPTFKVRYDKARQDMLDEAVAALQKRVTASVEGVWNIASDDDYFSDTPPQVRLNAYNTILRESTRYTSQANILSRLNDLEEKVNYILNNKE